MLLHGAAAGRDSELRRGAVARRCCMVLLLVVNQSERLAIKGKCVQDIKWAAGQLEDL